MWQCTLSLFTLANSFTITLIIQGGVRRGGRSNASPYVTLCAHTHASQHLSPVSTQGDQNHQSGSCMLHAQPSRTTQRSSCVHDNTWPPCINTVCVRVCFVLSPCGHFYEPPDILLNWADCQFKNGSVHCYKLILNFSFVIQQMFIFLMKK